MGTQFKTLLVTILVFGSMATSRAADFRLINNQFMRVYTNAISVNFTNVPPVTNIQDTASSVYHTWHIIHSSVGTNGTTTININRTIDGANFINATNYTVTTITTNFEFQAIGKWVQYQFIVTDQATNGTCKFLYIGQ